MEFNKEMEYYPIIVVNSGKLNFPALFVSYMSKSNLILSRIVPLQKTTSKSRNSRNDM